MGKGVEAHTRGNKLREQKRPALIRGWPLFAFAEKVKRGVRRIIAPHPALTNIPETQLLELPIVVKRTERPAKLA